MISNNATKPARIRGKHWCITINNYVDDDISQFDDIKEFTDYFVYGKEIGDSGTEHLQCYIAFKKATDIKLLKRNWPRGHFELMACKDPKKAADYCKKGQQPHTEWTKYGRDGPNFGKEADYIEYGEIPLKQSEKGGIATKQMWEEVKHNTMVGSFEKIPPHILIPHYGNLKKLYHDTKQHPKPLEETDNEWIWGEPGIGKSYTARKENPIYYDKMFNKWWDGYQGEPCVLLDDFDLEHKIFGHHLKRWADKYTFPAEVKNHVEVIRPAKIVVTSNYHPNEIWEGQMLAAIERRFKITKMVKLNNFDTTKKRKITDAPKKTLANIAKRPKLFRQNAFGEIVPTNGKEILAQSLLLQKEHTMFTPAKDAPDDEDAITADIVDSSSDTVPYDEDDETEDESQTLGSSDTYSSETDDE